MHVHTEPGSCSYMYMQMQLHGTAQTRYSETKQTLRASFSKVVGLGLGVLIFDDE